MPQLYSPVMKTNPSASRIWPASFSNAAGASPFGYSLYIRSSIGRPTALASISSTSSPRPRRPYDELREPNAHPVGAVRTVEHENAIGHGITLTAPGSGNREPASRIGIPANVNLTLIHT